MNQDEYQLLLNTIQSYEDSIVQTVERMRKETDTLRLIQLAKEAHSMREILGYLLGAKKDHEASRELEEVA